MKYLTRVKSATLLPVIAMAFHNLCEGSDQTTPEGHLDAIEKYVQDGQYSLAKDVARKWAAQPDTDLSSMSQACAFLSNKKLHDAAIILLERLDWIMPTECSWPSETLDRMKNRGMDNEIDRVLTYGTSLTAREYPRPKPSTGRFGRGTIVHPQSAYWLLSYHRRNGEQIEKLFDRYANELSNRPGDVGLLAEYAYLLAFDEHVDRAVEVFKRIDVLALDLPTLLDLTNMWSPHNDARLVQCTIGPLERALRMEMTDEEARIYTMHRQQGMSTSRAKRLLQERLLTDLAKRYQRVDRLDDAKKTYEEYLELPRRESWGDRTQFQKEYANLLKKLARPDTNRIELQDKARQSGEGRDWAELAACLQGQDDIGKAKNAWEKAIALTPPTPRRFKAERRRERYRSQLIVMLDDKKMYEEEIRILKDGLHEETWDFGRRQFLESIAKAYVKWGKKEDAITFLLQQLNALVDMRIVFLIVKTDHETALLEGLDISRRETERLPSWSVVLEKINGLEDPQKSEALAQFYHHYSMYAEYVDLMEKLPEEQIDWEEMDRLMDSAHRCKRNDRAVYWGKRKLEETAKKGFLAKIETLEDISDYAARAGDFDTSLAYAKKLCLRVPERFYFAKSLAKVAAAQDRRDELVVELRTFAQEHPNRWVAWRVLGDVYGVWGEEANRKSCLEKADRLK